MDELINIFDGLIAGITIHQNNRKYVIKLIREINEQYIAILGISCITNILDMVYWDQEEYARTIDRFLWSVIDQIGQYAIRNGQRDSFQRERLTAKVSNIRTLTGWAPYGPDILK